MFSVLAILFRIPGYIHRPVIRDALWEGTKFETSHPTSFSTSNKIPTVSDVEGALSLVAKQSGKMIYDVVVTVSDTAGNTMASKKATIIE